MIFGKLLVHFSVYLFLTLLGFGFAAVILRKEIGLQIPSLRFDENSNNLRMKFLKVGKLLVFITVAFHIILIIYFSWLQSTFSAN